METTDFTTNSEGNNISSGAQEMLSLTGLGSSLRPTPKEIRARRKAASISQADAAKLLHADRHTFYQWESGLRAMHPAFWELFRRKVAELILARTKGVR